MGWCTTEKVNGGILYQAGSTVRNLTAESNGNRTQMVVTGSESYTTSYTYDAANRLLTEVKASGLLTESTVYAYDNNGKKGQGDGSSVLATRTTVLAGLPQPDFQHL